MVKCCVVFCNSGYYKNNSTVIHQFRFPKDEELKKKWAQSIPQKNIVLNLSQYVY